MSKTRLQRPMSVFTGTTGVIQAVLCLTLVVSISGCGGGSTDPSLTDAADALEKKDGDGQPAPKSGDEEPETPANANAPETPVAEPILPTSPPANSPSPFPTNPTAPADTTNLIDPTTSSPAADPIGAPSPALPLADNSADNNTFQLPKASDTTPPSLPPLDNDPAPADDTTAGGAFKLPNPAPSETDNGFRPGALSDNDAANSKPFLKPATDNVAPAPATPAETVVPQIEFVAIPAGTFTMGDASESSDAEQFEKPAHAVEVSRAFEIGKHEITVAQFAKFVDATNYVTDAEKVPDAVKTWRTPGFPQTANHPVVVISWNDADAFCRWLSTVAEGSYRLPTEAEWEMACRAGSTTAYSSGDDPESLAAIANLGDKSHLVALQRKGTPLPWDDGHPFTAPVGSFKANSWDLHDMHGNVYEWCLDFYDQSYYSRSEAVDPSGPRIGLSRVVRGGCWLSQALGARASRRRDASANHSSVALGFRVVKVTAE